MKYHAANRRPPMRVRVDLRRQQGQSPVEIARFVHRKCGPTWSKKIPWTPDERRVLEQLDREFAERVQQRDERAAAAARKAAIWRASLPAPPPPPVLGRDGLSPTGVREILQCSTSELNRWSKDNRLPPDGQKLYKGVGPRGGKRWGRAWLSETIDSALVLVEEWRRADAQRGWISQYQLFALVRSRFPDAVFQWSPPWLGRQRVDIYVPSLNTAFEYQGPQHYRPIDLFGGEEGFRKTQARDARKRETLTRQGVWLVEWHYRTRITASDLDRALALSRQTICSEGQ